MTRKEENERIDAFKLGLSHNEYHCCIYYVIPRVSYVWLDLNLIISF